MLVSLGMVSRKNEANIMVKNAVDVIFGGLGFWMFGFAFTFGNDRGVNAFSGFGNFFTDAEETHMGEVFALYCFQASFATTATTIVSGAVAERMNLKAYIIFAFTNTLTYCFPAHWVWGEKGWLKEMGVIDMGGASPVHLVGGVAGLVATMMLKPRVGRFKNDSGGESLRHNMGCPTNVLLGRFRPLPFVNTTINLTRRDKSVPGFTIVGQSCSKKVMRKVGVGESPFLQISSGKFRLSCFIRALQILGRE